MKATGRAAALAIALTTAACGRPVSLPAETSTDIELGEIETRARDVDDATVAVELRWTFRDPTVTPIDVTELPPVFLFNERSTIRAVPVVERPPWNNGEARFEARVEVQREQWRQGCWQAHYRIVGVIASGPITCINQGL
jgi:hypothetical protein